MHSITGQTQPLAAPVLRRLRQLPSVLSGFEAPSAQPSPSVEWQKSLLGFFEGRTERPAERRRTGITEEVEELFREMQRMPRGRR